MLKRNEERKHIKGAILKEIAPIFFVNGEMPISLFVIKFVVVS